MTTNLIGTLKEHTNYVSSVAFNYDGTMLASGSWDKTIKLWNINTNECVVTLGGHRGPVYSVAFNTDGKLLASGSDDDTIKLWDILTMTCMKTLEEHTDCVWSIVFNGDGKMLASACGDKIYLTHIYTKKFVNTALMTMNRYGLIDDVIDNIMEKLGVIDGKGKITECVI